jgi:DNA-binding FadR family transcriptional regulator
MTDKVGSAKIAGFEATALPGAGTITVDIANLLGRDIVSGRFAQGETLPNEAEFSSSFAVGRSAVREAVKMLAAKGLVQSRPRRGTQVLPAKSWNFFDREVLSWLRDSGPQPAIIIELLELRLGVEPQAAALATLKGTADQIMAVRTAYDDMCAAAEGRADPVQADCAFHQAVIVATNNRFFQPFGLLIRTALSVTAPFTNALFGHSVGNLDAHRAVLIALQSAAPQEAHARMFEMLSEVLEAVQRGASRRVGRLGQ